MAKICKACGESNVVMLAKLVCRPVCKRCGARLPIDEKDRIVGGCMYAIARSAGEAIKMD
jgi:hypothetical protein